MDRLFEVVAQNWFWSVMGAVMLTAIITSSIRRMILGSARERTRREVAAYIAEGSMTPEQGERLMRAGAKTDD